MRLRKNLVIRGKGQELFDRYTIDGKCALICVKKSNLEMMKEISLLPPNYKHFLAFVDKKEDGGCWIFVVDENKLEHEIETLRISVQNLPMIKHIIGKGGQKIKTFVSQIPGLKKLEITT